MDVNNGFPVFDLHLVEHRVTQDSGGIDHRVKTAERRQRSIAHAFDSGIVGNAVAVCDRPATLVDDFLGDVIGRRSASAVVAPDRSTEIVDNDCGPLSCGRQRTFPPNSVAATRYQYDLAVQHAPYRSEEHMLHYLLTHQKKGRPPCAARMCQYV